MKPFFTTLLAIVCMVILLWGNFHWKDKTTIAGNETNIGETVEKTVNKEAKTPTKKKSAADLLGFTKNWPEEAVAAFEKSMDDERRFKILIAGSDALGDQQVGWAAFTKKELLETYGKDTIEVEIKTFDQNSMEFATENSGEIADFGADLVLFEPFTLRDNGVVKIEDSLENIQTVISETKENKPETTFILTPPHPIYNATFYPVQVEALKDFASQNEIAYLDHWESWPDPDSEEIKDFLSTDQSQPNEEGYKIWGEFVVDYLISE